MRGQHGKRGREGKSFRQGKGCEPRQHGDGNGQCQQLRKRDQSGENCKAKEQSLQKSPDEENTVSPT